MHTIPIIGLPVAVTDYAGAVDWILEHAGRRDRAYPVEAANTHVAALARSDERFANSMRKFDLICPDGMPLIWCLNAHLPPSERLTDRVYGPTLMLKTLEATSDKPQFRHFFLGGQQSTLDRLAKVFSEKFPNSVIGGFYSPPYGEWPTDEFDRICDQIRETHSNLIWVGVGCPKQEHWIAENKDRLPPGCYFGVGAAFAFHAGEVKQAPAFLQNRGLEWAYRLAMEPRRLFRRYFTYNSLFLYHIIRDRMRD
jgi:N-acetylglucosaminyldiphosphoundecaprenol N-acetyl-beta-D-mannosaminyltransferase